MTCIESDRVYGALHKLTETSPLKGSLRLKVARIKRMILPELEEYAKAVRELIAEYAIDGEVPAERAEEYRKRRAELDETDIGVTVPHLTVEENELIEWPAGTPDEVFMLVEEPMPDAPM